MTYNLEFKRKEKKYLIIEHSFEEIKQALEKNIPVYIFNGDKPVSYIQTTYFDSKDFVLFKEYLNRRKFRFKIRLRSYCQENNCNDDNLLELKVKHDSISYKKRIHLPLEFVEDFLAGEDLTARIKKNDQSNKDLHNTYRIIKKLIDLNNLVPIFQTSYERVAFQKRTDRVRITVDRNIKHLKLLGQSKQNKLDALVLESKIKGKNPGWNKKMVNRLSLIPQRRFSKFATGMNSIYFPGRGKYNFETDGKTIVEEVPKNIDESLGILTKAFKIEIRN
ncbi:MAG: polyphosphate polymerase domain-containing protein [Candidatus Cloacimonetes bacterium]|nr:polyphosphate polymerase domain-containing protein [Candidatus Cloacimonadota bacterium]